MTILIIEDQPGYAALLETLIKEIVKKEPIDLPFMMHAINLAEARKIIIGVKLDIIFLDVYLGIEDGVLFLREIRTSQLISKMFVVMMSGLGRNIDMLSSEKLDCDAYLDKNLPLKELTDFLKDIVLKRK